MRCITNRDVAILRNIESWERHYLKKILKTDQERYASLFIVLKKTIVCAGKPMLKNSGLKVNIMM